MTTTTTTATASAAPPFFSMAFSEKRNSEPIIRHAIIGTVLVLVVLAISLIASIYIPIISLVVTGILSVAGIVTLVVLVSLFTVYAYDTLRVGCYGAGIHESIKKIKENSRKELKKINYQCFSFSDDFSSSRHLPGKLPHYSYQTHIGFLGVNKRMGQFIKDRKELILNFDNKTETKFTSYGIEQTIRNLGDKLKEIRDRLKVFTDVKLIRKIESVLNHMEASSQLIHEKDRENISVEDAKVIFNIINKVRRENSEADHQIIKDQYDTIEQIYAYAKFLLGKALEQEDFIHRHNN